MKKATIAILGAGFSGGVCLLQLTRLLDKPAEIHIVEPNHPALGVAYGTRDPLHLLNVRADNMSLDAENPDDFLQWLDRSRLVASPRAFYPRAVYAQYLKDHYEKSLQCARQKGIVVHHHQARVTEVVNSQDGYTIQTDRKESIFVDFVIVAVGHSGNIHRSEFQSVQEEPRFVKDVWHAAFEGQLQRQTQNLSKSSRVLMLGTGLTAVDMIISLNAQGFQGRMTALSRHGWLPAVHAREPQQSWEWSRAIQSAPQTAQSLFQLVRQEVISASKAGVHWQVVIDRLRPMTQSIWKMLPNSEKKRFFNKCFTAWNIHRHRMAPEVGDVIEKLIREKRLEIIKGRMKRVVKKADALSVELQSGQELVADLILNCIGPSYQIRQAHNPLLDQLLDAHILEVHPSGMGVGIPVAHQNSVFCLGDLEIGALLECTAVPELRVRALEIAKRIAKTKC